MYSHGGQKIMNKPDVFYRKVGENIRGKRKERGLSQEGLAKAVGLKRPSMSNIEKGRQNILLHTFCDIAETLDSNLSALLPERPRPELGQMPDLTSFSKEVRDFVEAGIKPAEKEDSDGHSKTKN
jgi:transcriptional regulator with XRE-family HTH domain